MTPAPGEMVQVLHPPGEPGVPLHRCRDLVASQVEQGWGDIEKMRAAVLAAQRAVWRRKHKHPELGVVARIRPRVILLNVQPTVPNTADGAPKQPAKVNDQIGRYVAHITIDFLGS